MNTFCIPVQFRALNCVKWCLCTAAHLAVTLSTISSLISLSLCLYAFLFVELAKQAHGLKLFIHLPALQLLSWQPCMTGRKQTVVSELQSTWRVSTWTHTWADEELWYWDTKPATDCEVSQRFPEGVSWHIVHFYVISPAPQHNNALLFFLLFCGSGGLVILLFCLIFLWLQDIMQHLAYQPLFPAGSKYLQQKWDQSSYDLHKRKVRLYRL